MSTWRLCSGLIVSICLMSVPAKSRGEDAVLLHERFPVGCQYDVRTRTELSGSMKLRPTNHANDGSSLSITGTSSIQYSERVLAADKAEQVEQTIRFYQRLDFRRKVGDRPQESSLRSEVHRLVLMRRGNLKVPFSPDGPLTWGEMDLVRTDVFAPALSGLLSEKPVRPGDRWSATDGAVRELTDLEKIDEGRLECRLEEWTTLQGRSLARIALTGTVRGINEDGTNRQQLEGFFYFDRVSKHISYLSLRGIHFLLDKDGKPTGRIEGRFVFARDLTSQCREISPEALRGLALDPTPDNTRMLYDNPEVGIRFTHDRRWKVTSAGGKQVTLDGPTGNGVVITLEPINRVPTAMQFEAEARSWLQQQKANIFRVEQPRSVTGGEKFAIDAEVASQRLVLHYYIVRRPLGGATLAARLTSRDAPTLSHDIDHLASSLQITRGLAAGPKK